MNPTVQKVGYFVIGGLLGGSLGYMVGRIVAEKMIAKEEEESWDYDQFVKHEDGVRAETADESPVSDQPKAPKAPKAPKPNKIVDYGAAFKGGSVPPKPSIESLVSRDSEKKEESTIRIINLEEAVAFEETDHYDTIELTYYAGDDVVVDIRDERVEDVEKLVGPDALKSFGEGSDLKEMVYVINETREEIYEITRVGGTYSEEVLGIAIVEAPSKPSKKAANGSRKKSE